MPDEQSKDPKDEETPQDESTSEASPSSKKNDLRVSSHQDLGVTVSRDLNAGGWLARGDRSNMSKLSFSARAKPRDEPDPELQALRDPTPPRDRSREPAPPQPAAPAPPAASASPEPSAPPAPDDKSDGLLGRLGRLFGGE